MEEEMRIKVVPQEEMIDHSTCSDHMEIDRMENDHMEIDKMIAFKPCSYSRPLI